MPPFEKHLETSLERTGNSHTALHDWLDNHPESKAERHDLAVIPENIRYVRSIWGDEAVSEFLLHIVEDLAMKDIATLKNQGVPAEAVAHSVEVARKALEISSRIPIPHDRKIVVLGAVYHDLGKAKTYGIEHGEIGAAMAKELGLDDAVIAIILKHVRGGLTKPEAVELGLPVRDYTVKTPEETLVIYADRLVDIYTDGIVPGTGETDAENRFEEILETYEKYGKNAVTLKRYIRFNRDIHRWMAGE